MTAKVRCRRSPRVLVPFDVTTLAEPDPPAEPYVPVAEDYSELQIHMIAQVDNLIEAVGVDGDIYSGGYEPPYARSATFFGAGVDLTAISPYNSRGYWLMGGVLVSPRHALFDAHWPVSVGDVVTFIDADDNARTGTVAAVMNHPLYVPFAHGVDIQIVVFEADVDASITPMKTLPSNWREWMPALPGIPAEAYFDVAERYRFYDVPVLHTTKAEKVAVTDGVGAGTDNMGNVHRMITHVPDLGTTRYSFYVAALPGDCGNPIFGLVSGEAVLLAMLNGGVANGSFVPDLIDSINQCMSDLSDSIAGVYGNDEYQLTTVDLSGFTQP